MDRAERHVRTQLAQRVGWQLRFERAMPAYLLIVCLDALRRNGTLDPDEQWLYANAHPHVMAACVEPFADLPPKLGGEADQIASNVARWALQPYARMALAMITLGVLFWIVRRHDEGMLVMGDGHGFEAFMLIKEHLEREANEDGRLVDRWEYQADCIADEIEARLASLGLCVKVEEAA